MWRKKIKSDYVYCIGTGSYTGQKGALSYGEMLEEDGFTDEQIQRSISRSETKTITIHTKYTKLNDLDE